MMISGLHGSKLENTVMEDAFQVESISTAKLFGLANEEGVPIVAIDKSNIASVLPTLPFDVNIKEDITNAVNQGSQIRIPNSEITYEDWTGIGFLTENPATGEAGWMLSGMVAGGMTVWNPERWDEEIRERLEYPHSEPPNTDPLSAVSIEKVSTTDRQWGTVGKPLDNTLEVLVRDKNGKKVEGADVTFTIKAGGGDLETVEQLNDKPVGHGTTLVVETDAQGHARVRLVLGKLTDKGCTGGDCKECPTGLPEGNPTMWKKDDDKYAQQIGENIVDAALTASGTGLTRPFVAYAEPDYEKAKIRKTHEEEQWCDFWDCDILRWVGYISVAVEDQNSNPISNRAVEFVATDVAKQCVSAGEDRLSALLVGTDDPCMDGFPRYETCSKSPGAGKKFQVISSPHGASVEMFAGAVPNADYPITATCASCKGQDNSVSFTIHTDPFGNCSGDSSPSYEFSITSIYQGDQYGNNITACPVGSFIPVMVRMYHLR